MKKISIFSIISILVIAICSVSIFCYKNYANKEYYDENITQYTEQLAYINKNYSSSDNISNRIIVKSKQEINDQNAVCKAYGFAGLNILQYSDEIMANEALKFFKAQNYVEYAKKDSVVKLNDYISYDENYTLDTTKHLSWGSDILGVDAYQKYILDKYKSESALDEIFVAILDTGIDTDNEFLQGKIAYDLGYSFYDSNLYTEGKSQYNFEDDASHGTHVAGTIVDLNLDNIKLIPIKVLNGEGKGSSANVISGIEYVLKLKNDGTNICALNMSLGGYGENKEESDALTRCFNANIMPCIAAGNDSYYVEEASPANTESVLTIASFAQNEKDRLDPVNSYFSNFGSFIDLSLPGTNILSCVPDETDYKKVYTSKTGGKYAVISGTSMATPHATGLIALYATYYGSSFNTTDVEHKIKNSTYDMGAKGWDEVFGYGIPCMTLSIDKYQVNQNPTLSVGNLNSTYNFNNSISVQIKNNNNSVSFHTYKIYYTTDGSYPTLVSHLTYTGAIKIEKSTKLRFVIYMFDKNGNVCGDSDLFEATYYLGGKTVNDDGTGIVLNSSGYVTAYTSGIEDVILPEYINGVKVKGIAAEAFYGNNIKSFVCNYDIDLKDYPFVYCSSLESAKIGSTDIEEVFYCCFMLKSLEFPNAMEISGSYFGSSIFLGFFGNDTFYKCFNVESVIAPNVTVINANTFDSYKRLKYLGLNWGNITSIGESAFKDCPGLPEIVNFDSLTKIDNRVFDGSSLTTFSAKILKTIDYETFYCSSVKNIYLPSLEEIPKSAFDHSNGALETVVFGDIDISLVSGSLNFTNKNATIYCYDVEKFKEYTNNTVVDLNPAIRLVDGDGLKFEFTGFDTTLTIYRSSDKVVDSSDEVVDEKEFENLCDGTLYEFSKVSTGKYYYYAKLVDNFGNESTSELKQYEQSQTGYYNVIVNSNVSKHGLKLSSYANKSGEVVRLSLENVKGYKLTSITLDGNEIKSSFANNTYSFKMPSRSVKIKLNYEVIIYDISVQVSGEGSAKVVDSNGNVRTTAKYGEKLFVNIKISDGYVDRVYLKTASNKKRSIESDNQKYAFEMIDENSTIVVVVSKVNLSLFSIKYYKTDRTFEISYYRGDNEIVKIPQVITYSGISYTLKTIHAFAFDGNKTIKEFEVISAGDSDVEVEIQMYAFDGCENLRKISVPNCAVVAKAAFSDCSSLEYFDFSNVKELGERAFDECSSLKQVVLPKEITYIPQSCFEGCKSLVSINLENIKAIGRTAFKDCKKLAFVDLSSCEKLEYEDDETSSLYGYASNFYNCYALEKVILGKNLKIIPDSCFSGCISLSDINLENVIDLYEYALFRCNSLKSKTLNLSKCEKIEKNALSIFGGKLEFIDLSSIKSLDKEAFSYNSVNRIYLGKNTYYSSLEDRSIFYSFGLVYFDKGFEPAMSSEFKDFYSYKIDYQDYTIYSLFRMIFISFKLDNGTTIYENYYNLNIKINPPTTYQNEHIKITVKKWINKANDLILNAGEMQSCLYLCDNMIFVPYEYDAEYTNYTVKFFYNYDYDGSGRTNDDGDVFESLTYHYGDKIEALPKVPSGRIESDGYIYIFDRWSDGKNLYSNDNLPNVTGNMKFFAVYRKQKVEYNVSWYDINKKLIYSETVGYGDNPKFDSENYKISYMIVTNESIYTFYDWEKVVDETGLNISFYATYKEKARTYLVSWYDGDGNLIYTDYLNFNQTIVYNIEKYGVPKKSSTDIFKYIFTGWKNYTDGMKVAKSYSFYSQFDEKILVKTKGDSQYVDVSSLGKETVKIDKSDIVGGKSLVVKFAEVSVKFDEIATKFLTNASGDIIKIGAGFVVKKSMLYSFLKMNVLAIEVSIDGNKFSSVGGKIYIDVKSETGFVNSTNYGKIFRNGGLIDEAYCKNSVISLCVEKLGLYVYSYNTKTNYFLVFMAKIVSRILDCEEKTYTYFGLD